MISVYDNLLLEKEKNHIENFLRDPKFAWFLSSAENHYTTNFETIKNNSNLNSQETVLLTHDFYLDSLRNSENFLLSDFILNRFLERTNFPFKSLIRSKANLQLRSMFTDKIYTTPHIDLNIDHTVIIYYANDCDGDTYIFKNHNKEEILEQIEPKKGRFLAFDGNLYHSAGLPKNYEFRLNINYNVI
jgi:hypothetical protein